MPLDIDHLVGFDLETTGADRATALPVSYALVTCIGDRPVAELGGLVNPGVPIPPQSTEVHHITDEMVQDAVDLEEAADIIVHRLLIASQDGEPVVGMNVSYDLTIADVLARRFRGKGLVDLGWNGPVLDCIVLDRHFDRYRKGKRRLSDLCGVYGVELVDAHQARADVIAAVQVTAAILERHSKSLGARDLHELTLRQSEWHCEWLTNYNDWRLRHGEAGVAPSEFSWPLAADINAAA